MAVAGRIGSRSRVATDVVLAITGVTLVQMLPAHLDGDGLERYHAIVALAAGRGAAGAHYPVWGAIGALPLYEIGKAVGRPEAVTARYNAVLLAVGIAGLAVVLRHTLEARVLRHFLLLVVGASMFAGHALQFYGEVFTAVTVGVGLAAVTIRSTTCSARDGRAGSHGTGPWWGWALIVVGVANTPASVPALGLVCVHRLITTHRVRSFAALIAAVALAVADNLWRQVDPIVGSYANQRGARTVMPYSHLPGFSYPVVLGLIVIVFSFGKGLLFFTPGLGVALSAEARRRLGAAAPVLVTWLVFVAGLVIVYSRWWAWYGGVFWGPRFFLFACLPASLALAALLVDPPRRRTAVCATVVTLALSVWVCVDGAALQTPDAFRICLADHFALEHLCWFAPEFSPLWRPVLDHPHPDGAQLLFAAWAAITALWVASPSLRCLGRQREPTRPPRAALRWRW
ncbi:MAG: hypothetical protein NVS3B21_31350 [Acidimicrobiales bacterium]